MKQRLNYVEERTREHQESFEDFQRKFQVEQTDLDDLRQRLKTELTRLTIEDADEIEVSFPTKEIATIDEVFLLLIADSLDAHLRLVICLFFSSSSE